MGRGRGRSRELRREENLAGSDASLQPELATPPPEGGAGQEVALAGPGQSCGPADEASGLPLRPVTRNEASAKPQPGLFPFCSPGCCWRPHWLSSHKRQDQWGAGGAGCCVPSGTEKEEKGRERAGEKDQRRESGNMLLWARRNTGISPKKQRTGWPMTAVGMGGYRRGGKATLRYCPLFLSVWY